MMKECVSLINKDLSLLTPLHHDNFTLTISTHNRHVEFIERVLYDNIVSTTRGILMKIGFHEIMINPTFLSSPIGHTDDPRFTSLVKGDLMLRTLYIYDEAPLLFVSIDVYAISKKIIKKMNDIANAHFNQDVKLICNTTHTHSAPSMYTHPPFEHNSEFVETVLERFEICLLKCQVKETTMHMSFTEVLVDLSLFLELDKVPLTLLSLYQENKRVVNILFFSLTPSLIGPNTHYLSSDYVGVLMEKLKQRYPFESFMFFQQGYSDHRIETKRNLTYQDCIKLSQNMIVSLKKALDEKQNAKPLSVSYASVAIESKHLSLVSCTSVNFNDFNVLFTPFTHHSSISTKLSKHNLIVGLTNDYIDDVTDTFESVTNTKQRLVLA